MSQQRLRQTVLEALRDIAPEIDPAELAGDVPLQDQVDLDSMDLLELLSAVSERTGIDIPERDYNEVATLDGFVAYVAERSAEKR